MMDLKYLTLGPCFVIMQSILCKSREFSQLFQTKKTEEKVFCTIGSMTNSRDRGIALVQG